MAGQGGRKKFRFKNKLMSLDASVIDLSVSLFDWAKFRRTQGAIQLHLLLDHDGQAWVLTALALVPTKGSSRLITALDPWLERLIIVVFMPPG